MVRPWSYLPYRLLRACEVRLGIVNNFFLASEGEAGEEVNNDVAEGHGEEEGGAKILWL